MATPAVHHRHRHAARRGLVLGLIAALVVGGAAVVINRTAVNGGSQTSRPDLQRVIDGLVTGWSRITPGVTAYVAGPDGVWSGSAGIAAPGVPMMMTRRCGHTSRAS